MRKSEKHLCINPRSRSCHLLLRRIYAMKSPYENIAEDYAQSIENLVESTGKLLREPNQFISQQRYKQSQRPYRICKVRNRPRQQIFIGNFQQNKQLSR